MKKWIFILVMIYIAGNSSIFADSEKEQKNVPVGNSDTEITQEVISNSNDPDSLREKDIQESIQPALTKFVSEVESAKITGDTSNINKAYDNLISEAKDVVDTTSKLITGMTEEEIFGDYSEVDYSGL